MWNPKSPSSPARTRGFADLGEVISVNSAISTMGMPRYLSSDNDPLFEYHRWQANLWILEIDAIKSVPYTPTSHPFIERLIGTIRREYLDQTLFWNATDLERKLSDFLSYYNLHRTHGSLGGDTPAEAAGGASKFPINWDNSHWQTHCKGLYQLPIAAWVRIRQGQVLSIFLDIVQSPAPSCTLRQANSWRHLIILI